MATLADLANSAYGVNARGITRLPAEMARPGRMAARGTRQVAPLFQRLLDGVDVQATKHGHSETLWGDDSPTGRPTIYVNEDIYKGAAKDKMVKSEALHLLKLKDPELHAQIMASAQRDPEYMRWARDSYDIMAGRKPDPETGAYVPEERLERRSFDDWHNISRLDQVMGGYILAQDPDLPTMKNWRRDGLPIGPELRGWLDYLDGEFRR